MLAPGSVLQPFSYIPPGQVWAGNPARYVRDVEEDEKEFIRETAQENHDLGNAHADEYALDYPMVRTPASPHYTIRERNDDSPAMRNLAGRVNCRTRWRSWRACERSTARERAPSERTAATKTVR